MPTTRGKRAPKSEVLDLRAAGAHVGYAPDYLRKLMWSDSPPPLFKHRGKLYARSDELDVWIEERRSIPA